MNIRLDHVALAYHDHDAAVEELAAAGDDSGGRTEAFDGRSLGIVEH